MNAVDDDGLDRLRRRIRNLDAALLGLVAERMELAREVGRAKRERGVPLRDYEVEKRVLSRAAESAESLGVAPALARELMAQLVEESCRLQEVEHYSAFAGEAESALIVGGAGRMGRWLARFLESQGHRVRVHDPAADAGGPPVEPDLERGLADASIVFVATPLERVAASIDEVTAAGFRGVVCDVASLKEHLRPALERALARGARPASIHPMFGPAARTLSDKVVVLCDCGAPEATERVAGLFRETAVSLVPLSLERHDRIAAHVLGASHLVSLVFARALATSGLSHDELAAVGSTTFRNQMATTAGVVRESPELYYSIQRLNPFTSDVHRGLAAALGDWSDWIGRGDPASFAAAMAAARDWVGAGAAGPRARPDGRIER
jgi:chorismate mutase/prephenate dehydrogenase